MWLDDLSEFILCYLLKDFHKNTHRVKSMVYNLANVSWEIFLKIVYYSNKLYNGIEFAISILLIFCSTYSLFFIRGKGTYKGKIHQYQYA